MTENEYNPEGWKCPFCKSEDLFVCTDCDVIICCSCGKVFTKDKIKEEKNNARE